ncbi:hypothetical protein ACHQM5_006832 [Ranunculus cassubicifolius]
MEALLVLPNPINGFSPALITSINKHFSDLSNTSSIPIEIKKEYSDLHTKLKILRKSLSLLTNQWDSHSNYTNSALYHLNRNLQDFSTNLQSPDVIRKVDLSEIIKNELSILANELNRVEMVRDYAETTLNLTVLVGDIEDAVICVMNSKGIKFSDFKWKYEKLFLSVKSMNSIMDIVERIREDRPKWCNLLKSVNGRVDKPFGSLRLQVLADYRAILSCIGWPPSLLTSETESGRSSEVLNPLVVMHGEMKERYSQSFLMLCSLQQLQGRREEKNCCTMDRSYGLWPIYELVSTIALKMEHHFLKWFDQPKFVFALVYKITRDLAVGVDDVLQPLIDKARLVGCSAKEDWVCGMAEMLSTYLKKQVFSVLVDRYNMKEFKEQSMYSWLHHVDLIITFDKRMHTLADLGTTQSIGESIGFTKKISLLSIFCDRSDWIKIWARIELKDALKKVSSELEDPRSWMINNKAEPYTELGPESFILSSREDHKAPPIAETVLNITRAMNERCQTLPSISLQGLFIRSSSVKFLWHFFNIMLQRCTEIETVSAASYMDDDASVKVCGSINSARYCEYVLREWSEDLNFMEMKMAEGDSNTLLKSDLDDHCCFFWEEVKFLMKLETDWVIEIMTIVLRQFDLSSRQYILNKEQWAWKQEGYGAYLSGVTTSTVSVDFIEALEGLRNQLHALNKDLNSKDFLYLWRSISDGLDQFAFRSIIMSGATFSNQGVNQFATDMQALFLVFQPYCVRPEAFFPCIRESLKILNMNFEDTKQLLSNLADRGKRMEIMTLHGLSCISPSQAEKILSSKKFGL